MSSCEVSNYCRLCADIKLKGDLIDTLNNNLDIQQKIYILFEIDINEDCDLPKTICTECFEKVIISYEFKEVVSKSQDTLRDIISLNRNVKIEVNESYLEEDYADSNDADLNQDFFDIKCTPDIKSIKAEDDEFPTTKHGKSKKTKKTKDKTKEKSQKRGPRFSREVWSNYKWQCHDCNEDISSVKHLRRHYLEVHNQQPVYTCSECSKIYQYNQFGAFSKHICRHFNNRSKSRKFAVRTKVEENYMKTEDGKPVCGECGKIFKAVKYLRNHQILHLPEETKPKFTCTTCNKSFQTIYSLNYHTVIHSENRVYTYCEQCGKSFSNRRNLEIHKQTQHSEERPYHCDQCPKSFKSAPNLQTHLKAHRGLRPHRCDICSKLFATKGTLKRHSSTHSGVLPFECEYCHKRFRIAQFLKIHIRQHTGERPFSCQECNHHFANSSNYIKHMKGRHGIFSIAKNPVNCNIKYLIATTNKAAQEAAAAEVQGHTNTLLHSPAPPPAEVQGHTTL